MRVIEHEVISAAGVANGTRGGVALQRVPSGGRVALVKGVGRNRHADV
jgi:hypothetical protein